MIKTLMYWFYGGFRRLKGRSMSFIYRHNNNVHQRKKYIAIYFAKLRVAICKQPLLSGGGGQQAH